MGVDMGVDMGMGVGMGVSSLLLLLSTVGMPWNCRLESTAAAGAMVWSGLVCL
jgi:hypothetical protein